MTRGVRVRERQREIKRETKKERSMNGIER